MTAATDPFAPATLGGLELRNRFIKAATFEGMTPNGQPGERLREFHQGIAQGGVGLTMISYCTTDPDGRIMDSMMYLHDGIAEELASLIAELKASGTKVCGQMTHCGHFSQNRKLQGSEPPKGPSRMFVPIGLTAGRAFAPSMTHEDINAMVEGYREGAAFMKRVGFDAIEVHFGHGYGLSQFISPKTNRRTDEYGGSHKNRMRLPLRVLAEVRKAAGKDIPILGKISMHDGVRGGIDWEEGIRVAQSLDAAGIDAIVPSAGTSSFNTMMMFRGNSVAKGMITQQKGVIGKLALRTLAPLMWKTYPYEPTYLLDRALAVKRAVNCPVIYIGGVSTRADIDRVFEAGFDFVQMGRALLKDPEMVRNAAADPAYDSGCNHCNHCVSLINDPAGIRCVLNDKVA